VTRLVAVALLAAALTTGCSTFGKSGVAPAPPSEASTLTARGEQLARDGQPAAARDVFARVAQESTRDPVHARALHGLARLHVDPRSGLRDYRAAHAAFRRLLAEYPGSEWESEARAWDAVLTDLAARERDLAARDADVTRLRGEAAKIAADRDTELVRLRSEAAKMAADLQRLKRIDLNLERRR